MKLSWHIATRYLLAKKSHSVIHIISLVSVCGITVTTLALICTLSVYNGFHNLVAGLCSNLDAQLRIEVVTGKTIELTTPSIADIAARNDVLVFSPVIEDQALLTYSNKQMPVNFKGVGDNYAQLTRIKDILLDGEFILNDSVVDYATVGVGVANRIGVASHFVYPMQLYVPRRVGRVNIANPSNSFQQADLFPGAVFAVNQAEYDDNLIIIPIEVARRMLDYTTQASAIELLLTPEANQERVMQELQSSLGGAYVVKNRMMQQESAYRMMQIEKWITYLILLFILLIALFNVVGSLSILIVDKQHDISTLSAMGADRALIKQIFLIEGWLISAIGAVSGLVIGIILCLLQQHFGLISMGDNTAMFIVNAYPVHLLWSDVLIVGGSVLLLGGVTAWYPVSRIFR